MPFGGATVQMMKRARKQPERYGDYYTGDEMVEEKIKEELESMGDTRPLEVVKVGDEDYAYYPPGIQENWPFNRPAWRAGTYDVAKQAQTFNGSLICALCNQPIALNGTGKEVWYSKSGRKHETRPPIDHDGPDWIERLRQIKQGADIQYGDSTNLTMQQKIAVRAEVEDAFHAPTLQIAHMACNSAKAKQ